MTDFIERFQSERVQEYSSQRIQIVLRKIRKLSQTECWKYLIQSIIILMHFLSAIAQYCSNSSTQINMRIWIAGFIFLSVKELISKYFIKLVRFIYGLEELSKEEILFMEIQIALLSIQILVIKFAFDQTQTINNDNWQIGKLVFITVAAFLYILKCFIICRIIYLDKELHEFLQQNYGERNAV